MRVAAAPFVCALAVAGCATDPAVAASGVVTPEPDLVIVRPGDRITVDHFDAGTSHAQTIAPDGSIDIAPCGRIEIAAREPMAACEAIVACRAAYVRAPMVRVVVGDEATDPGRVAVCSHEAAEVPGVDPAVAAAVELAAREQPVDAHVLGRAIEVAAELAAALAVMTPAHPDVLRVRARLDRLLASAASTHGDPLAVALVRADLQRRADADKRALEHDGRGDRHPERRQRLARLAVLDAAVARMVATPPTAAQQHVDALACEAEIEAWTLAVPTEDPRLVAAQRCRVPIADAPDPACEEVQRAIDLRLARLRGRRDAASDPIEIDVADTVIDALILARVAAPCHGAGASTHSSPPT